MLPIASYWIASAEEMESLATRLLNGPLAGQQALLLLLEGEMGAGKTTFARGFAAPLSIKTTINSPTFNLLHHHSGTDGELYHYDLYRIADRSELAELGFEELWSGSESQSGRREIHLIEWWQRAGSAIDSPLPAFRISIKYNVDAAEEPREVAIYGVDSDS